MKNEPEYNEYIKAWANIYEKYYYEASLSAWFLSRSHVWSETLFSKSCHFDRVLEVGAGTGVHLDYVNHTFNEYKLTDLDTNMLGRAKGRLRDGVVIEEANACKLHYSDHTFDRLIAAHILEHLPNPHVVLREWVRVLKPGGILTILLPCDPGLCWRLGRNLIPKQKFHEHGIDYDYMMAREHINPITNLVSFIDFYFNSKKVTWRPSLVPSIDLNLFYIVHITI